MNLYSFKRLSLVNIVLCGVLVLLAACKKETGVSGVSDKLLRFEIKGVLDGEKKEIKASAVPGTREIEKPVVVKREYIKNPSGLDVEIELLGFSDVTSVNTDKMAKANALATSSPLTSGVKYRVLVYDEDGHYVGAVDGTAGSTAVGLGVETGKKYHWYAYSFETTADLPAIANTSDPDIVVDERQELLYARGTVDLTVLGNNPVPVVFERRRSQVKLVIDARGTFAPILADSTKITTSNLTKSKFKIKEKAYEERLSITGVFKGGDTIKSLNPATQDSVVYVNIYATDDARNAPFSFNFDSLALKLDYTRPNGTPATRIFTNVAQDFSFVPEPGHRYVVNVRLIESGVEIPFSRTKWARGNLYYTWQDNGFRFRHSGTYPYQSRFYPWIYTDNPANWPTGFYYTDFYASDVNFSDFTYRPVEFWNFKTIVPYAGDQLYDVRKIDGETDNESKYLNPYIGKGYYYDGMTGFGAEYYAAIPEGDPCSLVYPAGTWRLPTKKEAEDLVDFLRTNSGRTVHTDHTNRYYVGRFTYNPSVPDVYGNIIEFPFNGSITTAAGWSSGGWGPGYPSDQLGYTGDARFGYEMTNSFYYSVGASSPYEKSAYMMYWTSEQSSTNGRYPYAWAYGLKIKDGDFAVEAISSYPNTAGGYPTSEPGGPRAPIIREAYQGDGLNIRCVRAN